MPASDGRMRETDCSNIEGMFRIIQSIPSLKAEPFKLWLAKLAKERIAEIEKPELAVERARDLYSKKGYPDEWIDQRIQGIAIRKKLTDEWEIRGAEESRDYAILTNDIMQHAFGKKVNEYKDHKGLKNQELRDHMTDIEIALTHLAEAVTTELHKNRDSHGMPKLKCDAKDGGTIAGDARKNIEKQTGNTVISKDNFLALSENKKKKDLVESSESQ